MVKLANSSLTNNHDPDGCPRVGLFARLSPPAFITPSAGIISQEVLPVGVMVHFIWRPTIAMSGIGIIGAAIIGFHHPPIIMSIGIICIAGFMVGLPSKSEKKLHVSYSRDKMHRRDRQQWNISSVRFLQQDDRTARRSERFVCDNGGISSKPIDLPCNPKGSTLRPQLAHADGANGPLELKT